MIVVWPILGSKGFTLALTRDRFGSEPPSDANYLFSLVWSMIDYSWTMPQFLHTTLPSCYLTTSEFSFLHSGHRSSLIAFYKLDYLSSFDSWGSEPPVLRCDGRSLVWSTRNFCARISSLVLSSSVRLINYCCFYICSSRFSISLSRLFSISTGFLISEVELGWTWFVSAWLSKDNECWKENSDLSTIFCKIIINLKDLYFAGLLRPCHIYFFMAPKCQMLCAKGWNFKGRKSNLFHSESKERS